MLWSVQDCETDKALVEVHWRESRVQSVFRVWIRMCLSSSQAFEARRAANEAVRRRRRNVCDAAHEQVSLSCSAAFRFRARAVSHGVRCIKQAMSLSYKAHFCSKQGVRTSTAALFRLLSEFRQCVQALNALTFLGAAAQPAADFTELP